MTTSQLRGWSPLMHDLAVIIGRATHTPEVRVMDAFEAHEIRAVVRKLTILNDAPPVIGTRDETIDHVLAELVPDPFWRAETCHDIEQRLDREVRA